LSLPKAPKTAPAKAAPAKAAPAPAKAAPAAGGDFARYEVDEKFWSIKLHGSSHTVCFGKQGTNGSTKTKDFDSAAEAKKDHDKLVKEKTGKGYELVSGAAAPAAPAPAAAKAKAKVDEDEDEDDEGGGAWRRFEVDEKFWAIMLDGAAYTHVTGVVGVPRSLGRVLDSTLAYAEVDLDNGKFNLVQAGHPHPAILRAGGQVEYLGNGGLPIGRSTLISGTSGTGKTVFSLNFLYNGIRHFNEPGIFVTFEESPLDILRNAASFGWNLQ
jgi:predicted DNA-binding WGR domain protein